MRNILDALLTYKMQRQARPPTHNNYSNSNSSINPYSYNNNYSSDRTNSSSSSGSSSASTTSRKGGNNNSMTSNNSNSSNNSTINNMRRSVNDSLNISSSNQGVRNTNPPSLPPGMCKVMCRICYCMIYCYIFFISPNPNPNPNRLICDSETVRYEIIDVTVQKVNSLFCICHGMNLIESNLFYVVFKLYLYKVVGKLFYYPILNI